LKAEFLLVLMRINSGRAGVPVTSKPPLGSKKL
jgi:hypothetical protein